MYKRLGLKYFAAISVAYFENSSRYIKNGGWSLARLISILNALTFYQTY